MAMELHHHIPDDPTEAEVMAIAMDCDTEGYRMGLQLMEIYRQLARVHHFDSPHQSSHP